ncbi:hypothetical protein UPYG_G00141780 [Umbra pygmaea]|uniref:Uncharacterized protein n=1 Tax=Umbra pygmaea TaxID=75934 RepID=A0ABD0WVH8_UMBPY
MNNKADYLAFPAIVGTTGQYNTMRKTWDDKRYKYHMDRMQKAKPMVDNKTPRTYLHCHLKMKKVQMEKERLMEVERDNRLLESKISCIMSTKGGLDTWNNYQPIPSLSANLRKRELAKISLENQALLKKINMTKSVYDHKIWLNDFKVTRGYVNRISKYPEQPRPAHKHNMRNFVENNNSITNHSQSHPIWSHFDKYLVCAFIWSVLHSSGSERTVAFSVF